MRALALLAVLACATPASDTGPAIGRFLIARPQVGGFFSETVIVLVDHSEAGSLGLIVNRPIEVSLAELLPEIEGARGHDEPGFLGGPVATSQLLLLVRAGSQPVGAAPVLDHVFVSGSRDTLRALLEKAPEGSEFRAYVGYAGWAPGQLEAEIARGDWLLAPGDAASVFTHDPGELWQTLLTKHQMIPVEWLPPRRQGVVAALAKSINLSPPWRSAAASSASPTSGRARSSTR
jgi:putative transcriptional regulator